VTECSHRAEANVGGAYDEHSHGGPTLDREKLGQREAEELPRTRRGALFAGQPRTSPAKRREDARPPQGISALAAARACEVVVFSARD